MRVANRENIHIRNSLGKPALFHRLFDFFLVVKVERDSSIDLLHAQRRIMRADCLRIFTIVVFRNDAGDGHTTAGDEKPGFPAFNDFDRGNRHG